MKEFRAVALLLLGLGAPLVAQSPTVVTRMDWSKAYGGPYEIYYQAVPTSSTTVDSRDSRLLGYCVFNNSGISISFTIQTGDNTPLPLPLTGALAAGTSACNNSPFGLLSKSGFSVQASATGLYYQAVWTH